MAAQPPFAVPGSYDTKLDPLRELLFRQWVQQNNVPFDANAKAPTDYDMRGYFQGVQQGNPMARSTETNANDGKPHYTDYYKTPLHQTFSAESQWAGPNAPQWVNDSQLAAPNGKVVFDEKQPNPLVQLLMGQR